MNQDISHKSLSTVPALCTVIFTEYISLSKQTNLLTASAPKEAFEKTMYRKDASFFVLQIFGIISCPKQWHTLFLGLEPPSQDQSSNNFSTGMHPYNLGKSLTISRRPTVARTCVFIWKTFHIIHLLQIRTAYPFLSSVMIGLWNSSWSYIHILKIFLAKAPFPVSRLHAVYSYWLGNGLGSSRTMSPEIKMKYLLFICKQLFRPNLSRSSQKYIKTKKEAI